MLSHHSQLETFTHFFPHSSEETKAETQTQAFQKALWPFLNEKWREHVEEIVETIKGFKDQMRPNVYRACIEGVQRYINSRDFAVSGRYEVKKSWFFSGIQYYGETAVFHELNQQLDGLLAEIPQTTSQQKKSWSESVWSGWSSLVDLFSSAVSFAAENPGKAMCSVLALETAAVAALSITRAPYPSSLSSLSSSSLHPSHLDSANDQLSTDSSTTDLPTTDLFATGAPNSFQPMVLADFSFNTEFKSESVSMPHHTTSASPRAYPKPSVIDMRPQSTITIEEIDGKEEEHRDKRETDAAEKDSHSLSDFVAVETKEKPVRNLYTENSASRDTQIQLRTAQDNFSPVKNSVQNQNTDSFGLSCTHSIALGLMSSLFTQNPLFFGASTLFCLQSAYGQIVNEQIPDQLINVGKPFKLDINMTELFNGPVTDVIISQGSNNPLPTWMSVGPTVLSSLKTNNANRLVVNGDYVYLADLEGGVKIIDASNVMNPILRGSYATNDATDVAIKGNLLYVADYGIGFKIVDVSNSTNPILLGNLAMSQIYRVTIANNYAYVADNSPGGMKIIDISNAAYPALKGSFVTTETCLGIAIGGNYAYMADSSVGLKIIDISDVTNPILKGGIFTGAFLHDITISSNLVYLADGTGLEIIDVNNSTNPVLKANLVANVGLGVAIQGNTALIADGDSGLKIVDISNPNKPYLKGKVATYYATGIAMSGNLIYVADSSAGVKIIDITSVWEINGVPIASKQKYNMKINATDTQLQPVIKDFTISTDYFPESIGVIKDQSLNSENALELSLDIGALFQDKDIDDTLSLKIEINNQDELPSFIQFNALPYIVGEFLDTNSRAHGIVIIKNYAYLTCGSNGLKIIDISNRSQPTLVGSLATTDAWKIVVSSSLAYLADGSAGLKIIDLSNAPELIVVGKIVTYNAIGVAIRDNLAYIADGGAGLKIIEVRNVTQPILIGNIATSTAYEVVVNGNLAYIADDEGGLKVIDVSNITRPLLVGMISTHEAFDVAIRNNLVYIADGWGGLKIIDVSNSTQPILTANYGGIGYSRGIVINSNIAYIVAGDLKIFDISNATNPVLQGSLGLAQAFGGVAVSGNLAYVSDKEGLKIVDLTNYQLTANPTHQDERNYKIVIAAADPLFASVNTSFILRIEGAPRLLQSPQPQIALIDQPFSYFVPQGSFWDPNNDVITFEAQSFPGFLTFNPSSATFWGIPTDSDKGEYNITIFATDRITTPTPANLNLLVHYAPTLNKPIPSQVANIGQLFSLIVDPNTFADKDAEYFLTYTAMRANQYPLPTWLNFNNQTQTFSGIPKESNKGPLTLEVVADDGLQGQASAAFDLVVEHFPHLTQNFSTVYAAIGHSFTFNAFNYFVDSDGNVLQFSATSFGKGLPSGLVFDSVTCRFSGTPDVSDRGSIPITLTASDYYGGSVQTQFNLTVDDYTKIVYATNPSGATVDNRLPVLAGTLLQQTFTAGVHGEFSVHTAFQDPDGDPLIFSVDLGGADNWLTLDHNTGLFSGTPSSRDAATYATRRYTIGVTAMDPANKTAAGTFDILLLGPSLTEKILNAIFAIGGVLVGTYGYYQKKYLLWNWCRKSKYKQPDLQVSVGQAGTLYQVNYPSEKIKSIIVTTIRDRRCISRDNYCCNVFKDTDEYIFPRVKVNVLDWLQYDPKSNKFELVEHGPGEEARHEDIEIQIRGADNRIMEQFTIKVRNKNEVQATVAALSDEPFALQMEEKSSSSSSSSVTQAFTDSSSPMTAFSYSSSSSSSSSAALMGSMGFFNSNSKQDVSTRSSATTASAISERGSVNSSGTPALRIPLLNAT